MFFAIHQSNHTLALRNYLPPQFFQTLRSSTTFTIDQLIDEVARWRSRPIVTIAWRNLPLGLFGARVATPDRDYIIFEAHTPRVHADHTKAHELGHIIAGHPAIVITEETPIDEAISLIHKRSTRTQTYQEEEAEALASAIQTYLLQQCGWNALTHRTATAPVWSDLAFGLGLDK